MKLILLLTLLFSAGAHASELAQAFSAKDFRKVEEIYKRNPDQSYTPKELVYISYSLRRLGFYRQDIKLNVRLINEKYKKLHRKIVSDVARGETIDSEGYPEALKVLYWNLLNDYGRIIKSYEKQSKLIDKDHKHYLMFSKILSELEFREGKVDRFNDKILAHLKHLEDKVYRFTRSLSFQYVSWQTEATLAGNAKDTGLVITNSGVCAGGEAGWENAFYHFYVDGCVIAGSGGVSADASSPVTYQQSSVPAYGAKLSPGASMIVSSSGSRIGVRLPIIYTHQTLQDPKSDNYNIEQNEPLAYVASLYSRWQFKTWYFQSEFGKYFQAEQTYWGLGLGKNF